LSILSGSSDASQKFAGADEKLLVMSLQYDSGLARCEGRPPLDNVGLSIENDFSPRGKLFKPKMIALRIDSFHSSVFIAYLSPKRKLQTAG
jgi:hypothetical protein